MFDLFHLFNFLDHSYREENGERVHSYRCRRCTLRVRLRHFKVKIDQVLRDIDSVIGEPIEKKSS